MSGIRSTTRREPVYGEQGNRLLSLSRMPQRDPFLSNVSLLLPCNGANGSTTFVNAVPNGVSVAAFGNAQISTAQSKYGKSSGAFDGNGDYITAGPSTALQLGTGNFTIEMWARFNAISNQVLYETMAIGGAGARNTGFLFALQSTGKLNVFSGATFRGASSTTLVANTWYHLALIRSGNTWSYKIDGATDSTTFTLSLNATDQHFICGRLGDSADYYLNGNIEDLRVTKGIARSFNVPPSGTLPIY